MTKWVVITNGFRGCGAGVRVAGTIREGVRVADAIRKDVRVAGAIMISAMFRSERACVCSPARERRDYDCINRKQIALITNYYYYYC